MNGSGAQRRDGPAGRRATIIGGPDVCEVVRAIRDARAADPELTQAEIVEFVTENTGTTSWLCWKWPTLLGVQNLRFSDGWHIAAALESRIREGTLPAAGSS